MRIRATKPEFWQLPELNELDWGVVYSGPVPERVNLVAPVKGGYEYVYLLLGKGGDPVYIGRSFRPADRISKHRRKPWWHLVSHVAFIEVAEVPVPNRRPSYIDSPNSARFEALAIQHLNPSANIARPQRMVNR